MGQEVAGLIQDFDAMLPVRDCHVHVQPEDDQRPHHVLQLFLEHLVAVVVGDLLLLPARERMRAGAGDAHAFRLQQVGQRAAHVRQLVPRLVDVLAYGGSDLDNRLHHLPLDLLPELRSGGREQRVDVRVELPRRVDDLVLLLDPDRQQPVLAHADPSMTNVGTRLPAPAVTFRRASAETRVMNPPARPLKRYGSRSTARSMYWRLSSATGNLTYGIATASWTT